MTRLAADHFEGHYAESEDPWGYATRWYEQRKYHLTVASLPKPTYRSAFEPGCSIGVLTELLAARCDRLLSVDMSTRAVDLARQRIRATGLHHVELRQMRVPDDWPEQRAQHPFDLVVLSEFAYYLDGAGAERLFDATQASLGPGGHVVAVHWRGIANDYLLAGGDDVHARLLARPGFRSLVHHVEEDFRLDVLERA